MKRLSGIILAFCLVACSNGDDLSVASGSAQSASQAREFAFTPREFAEAFNTAARIYGQPFYINTIEIRRGAVHDYFQQVFDTGISVTAGISKNTGNVTTITALVGKKGAPADRDILISLSEIVTAATNPGLSADKVAAMVASMLQESSPAADAKMFPQRFINHVRYALRNEGEVIYWWIANPI